MSNTRKYKHEEPTAGDMSLGSIWTPGMEDDMTKQIYQSDEPARERLFGAARRNEGLMGRLHRRAVKGLALFALGSAALLVVRGAVSKVSAADESSNVKVQMFVDPTPPAPEEPTPAPVVATITPTDTTPSNSTTPTVAAPTASSTESTPAGAAQITFNPDAAQVAPADATKALNTTTTSSNETSAPTASASNTSTPSDTTSTTASNTPTPVQAITLQDPAAPAAPATSPSSDMPANGSGWDQIASAGNTNANNTSEGNADSTATDATGAAPATQPTDSASAAPAVAEKPEEPKNWEDVAKQLGWDADAHEEQVVLASNTKDAGLRNNAPVQLVSEGIDDSGRVRLTTNKSLVIKTRAPYKRLSIAQPDIADINPIGPGAILMSGKKSGTTQLIVWDDNDRSQIIDVAVTQDLSALQDQVKAMFPDSAIEVQSVNGGIALRGRVPNLQVAEQAVALSAPYSDKILNFLEIGGGQQVMLQVRFLEVSRSATRQLGFSGSFTDGNIAAGVINGPNGDPIGALATGQDFTIGSGVNLFGSAQIGNTAFEYFLQALKNANLARVLAEPNVVAISGQRASFLAGGEVPVPVPQAGTGGSGTITIEYKPFGVKLDVVPIVLGDGRIRLKVAPEVSDLDFTNSVSVGGSPVPGLKTRRVDTTVELAEGQTFGIAGLLNNRVTASRSVTPGLGELPVIGALFRSVRYERSETELVVLVTPKLAEPLNPAQVPELPGEHWRHPHDVELYAGGDLGGPIETQKVKATKKTAAKPAQAADGTTTSDGVKVTVERQAETPAEAEAQKAETAKSTVVAPKTVEVAPAAKTAEPAKQQEPVKTEVKTEAKTEIKAEAKTAPKVEVKSEPTKSMTDVKSEVKPEAKTEVPAVVAPQAAQQPAQQPAPQQQPQATVTTPTEPMAAPVIPQADSEPSADHVAPVFQGNYGFTPATEPAPVAATR